MNRGLLLSLLLLALVVGAFVFIRSDDTTVTPGVNEGNGGTETTNPEDLRTGRDGPGDTNPERVRVDDSVEGGIGEPMAYRRALSGLRGRLIWAGSREPIAGVEVKLIEAWLDAVVPTLNDLVGAEKMRSPVVFRGKTRTDEDGVFELHGVHGRSMMLLAIGLKTETAAVRPVPQTPAPGELVDLGDLEILERGIVSGRVVDESGKAVAGARVRIADVPKIAFQFGVEQFDPEGMGLIVQGPYRVVLQLPPWLKDYDEFLPFGDGHTDHDGHFEIRGVRPGTPSIIVTKFGMAPYVKNVSVAAEQVNDVGNISIGEGEFLSGTFRDGDGKPLPGIRVTAGSVMPLLPGGLLQKPIKVDAKGKFEISGLPRGPLYLCYQRKRGEPWEVTGPHRGDADLKLTLGALRSGTVTIKPMTGGEVHDVQFDLFIADVSSYLPGFETHISGKKHFSRDKDRPNLWHVRELPSGIYKVIAKAKGFAFGTGVLDLSKKTPEERTEEIELYPAPEQRFEARDEKGRPVHAARIYWNASTGRKIEKSARRRLTKLPVLLGKTDANGELVVDSLEVGATSFYCRHPAFALDLADEAVQPGTTIRFVLGKTGRLVGEVAENGRRPTEVRTVIAEPTSKLRRKFAGVLMPRLTTTMPDGSFSFPSIQPGDWRLRAVKDVSKFRGSGDWRRMRDTRGGAVEVKISPQLESFVLLEIREDDPAVSGGSLVGSVHIGGKPAEGVRVQTWAGRNRTEVAENGTFELTGLKDGDLWIGVERPGHEGLLPNRLWEGRVLIKGGAQAVLHLDLQVADVTVDVVDERGEAVAGLPIELLGESKQSGGHTGRVRMAVATNSSGQALFTAVPAGEFRVRSVMQRNPVLTVPEVPLKVWGGRPVQKRLVASAPAIASGTVQWDESELLDDLEREYARKLRPTYLVFASEGRYTWGPVTKSEQTFVFKTRKSAPGTYRLDSRGKLRWTSTPLVIPVGGVSNATIRLRPDAAQVRAAVEPLRPKKKPDDKKPDEKKSGQEGSEKKIGGQSRKSGEKKK
jgi:hypothetical protein